jgi:hypothetical protein
MPRRVSNYYSSVALIDGHYVSRSEDTDDSKHQVDLIKAAHEVPFLVAGSELQDRKNKRRKKHNAKSP